VKKKNETKAQRRSWSTNRSIRLKVDPIRFAKVRRGRNFRNFEFRSRIYASDSVKTGVGFKFNVKKDI